MKKVPKKTLRRESPHTRILRRLNYLHDRLRYTVDRYADITQNPDVARALRGSYRHFKPDNTFVSKEEIESMKKCLRKYLPYLRGVDDKLDASADFYLIYTLDLNRSTAVSKWRGVSRFCPPGTRKKVLWKSRLWIKRGVPAATVYRETELEAAAAYNELIDKYDMGDIREKNKFNKANRDRLDRLREAHVKRS